MLTRWIKKKLPNQDSINNSSRLGVLKKYFNDPSLWSFECDNVARGVAIGLFVAMIPIIPFQLLLMFFLAIVLRANIPIAFLLTWVSNPLTILPIAYATYRIGDWFIGEDTEKIVLSDFNFDWTSWHAVVESFNIWVSQFGKAFFVGLPILALIAALSGYLMVFALWYLRSWLKKLSKGFYS